MPAILEKFDKQLKKFHINISNNNINNNNNNNCVDDNNTIKIMTTKSETTSSTPSQPDSLDLDYDMWQGQFEFVGDNNNNNNNSTTNNDDINYNKDINDLKLNNNFINNNNNVNNNNQPILIDDETFLSLQLSDFDAINSGPNSDLFIDNIDDLLINNLHNNSTKLINNLSVIEELNNVKNNHFKLMNNENNLSENHNNKFYRNNSNNSLIKTDLCDNLNEQVR